MEDYERFLTGLEEKEVYQQMLEIVKQTFGEIKKARHLIYSPEEACEIGSTLLGYESWQIHKEWMTEKQPILHPAVKKQFEASALITNESYEANEKRQV